MLLTKMRRMSEKLISRFGSVAETTGTISLTLSTEITVNTYHSLTLFSLAARAALPEGGAGWMFWRMNTPRSCYQGMTNKNLV